MHVSEHCCGTSSISIISRFCKCSKPFLRRRIMPSSAKAQSSIMRIKQQLQQRVNSGNKFAVKLCAFLPLILHASFFPHCMGVSSVAGTESSQAMTQMLLRHTICCAGRSECVRGVHEGCTSQVLHLQAKAILQLSVSEEGLESWPQACLWREGCRQ